MYSWIRCVYRRMTGTSDGKKVRIRAMDEEEEAQFRKEHGDCVCGSFLGTEKGWLCNRTLAMSVERDR